MMLSDLSVRRPVFAAVLSLLLIAFGLLSFDRLPLREYPDINPPIVSVETRYPGASARWWKPRLPSSSRTPSLASRGSHHRLTSRDLVTVEFEVGGTLTLRRMTSAIGWPGPWIGSGEAARRRSPRPTRIPSRSWLSSPAIA